jgi:hypothetical protein
MVFTGLLGVLVCGRAIGIFALLSDLRNELKTRSDMVSECSLSFRRNVVRITEAFCFSECFAHRLAQTACGYRDRRRELPQELDPECRMPVSTQAEFDPVIGS